MLSTTALDMVWPYIIVASLVSLSFCSFLSELHVVEVSSNLCLPRYR